jgi:hypothetical protein
MMMATGTTTLSYKTDSTTDSDWEVIGEVAIDCPLTEKEKAERDARAEWARLMRTQERANNRAHSLALDREARTWERTRQQRIRATRTNRRRTRHNPRDLRESMSPSNR